MDKAFQLPNTLAKQSELAATTETKRTLVGAQSGEVTLNVTPGEAAFYDNLDRVSTEFQEREESAWAKDRELSSLGGQAKNLTAFGASGFNYVGSLFAGIPNKTSARANESRLSDRARRLLNQDSTYKQELADLISAKQQLGADTDSGKFTPEQLLRQNNSIEYARQRMSKPLTFDENTYLDSPIRAANKQGRKTAVSANDSYRSLNASYVKNQASAKRISKIYKTHPSIEGIVNDLNRVGMGNDLSETYARSEGNFSAASKHFEEGNKIYGAAEVAAGVSKLIIGALGDSYDNPAAVFEYVAENLPQLALGGLGGKGALATMNYGYALDTYSEGISAYQESHEGQLPTKANADKILAVSLLAGGLEYFGEAQILSNLKGTSFYKGALQGATKSPKSKVAKAVNTVANTAVGKVAKAGAKGYVTEGLTEAAQTAIESGYSKLETPDGEEVFKGGAIGAASGSGLSGGAKAISEAADGLKSGAQKTKVAQVTKDNLERIYAEALDTGDISEYTDKSKKASYDPGQAAAVLRERLVNGQLSEEEATLTQANMDKLARDLSEEIQTYETELASTNTLLGPDFEQDVSPEEKAQLEEVVGIRTEAIATAQAHLDSVNQVLNVTQGETTPVADDVTQLVSDATSTVGDTSVASRRVVTLAMENPDALDESSLDILASDTSSSFSPQERKVFRTLSDARIADNALKDLATVSDSIYKGSEGYKGLSEYRTAANLAAKSRDVGALEQGLEGINAFLRDHSSKSRAIVTGVARATKGNPLYLSRRKDAGVNNGWKLTSQLPKGMSASKLAANGGLTLHASSTLLADALPVEVAAIKSVRDVMQAQLGALQPTKQRSAEPDIQPDVPPVDSIPDADIPAAPIEQETSSPTVQAVKPAVETDRAVGQEGNLVDEVLDSLSVTEESGSLGATTRTVDRLEGNLSPDDFTRINQVTNYFTQTEGRGTDATKKPLVSQKDFLNYLREFPERLKEHLGSGNQVTAEQGRALNEFIGFALRHDAHIQANAKYKVSPDFRHRNFITYLRNDIDANGLPVNLTEGTPVLDQNLSTAIALAAFSYVAENSGGNGYNTASEINSKLSREANTEISNTDWNVVGELGTNDKLVIQSLGDKAYWLVGFTPQANTPDSTVSQLKQSLGLQALALLLDKKLVKESKAEIPNNVEGYSLLADQTFITFERNSARIPINPEVNNVRESQVGSQNVINKLFGSESSVVYPTSEPKAFKQVKAKGSLKDVPDVQAKVYDRVAKNVYRVNTSMDRVKNLLNAETFLGMAGYVDTTKRTIHANNLKGVLGKNNSIELDLSRFEEYQSGLAQPDAKFYIQPVVAIQQRVGFAQNAVDPQGSKLVRQLVAMDVAESKIDLGNPDSESYQYFHLAVGQALGVDVDKNSIDGSLSNLQEKLSIPIVAKSVEILREALASEAVETLSSGYQFALGEAVKELGEDLHPLNGLIAWAEYLNAKESGAEFSTNLTLEVDGVTNGPALAHILLGQITSNFGELFGFYKDGSQHVDYPGWKSVAGNRDLYEVLTGIISRDLQDLVRKEHWQAPTLTAITYFTGSLTDDLGGVTSKGRKLIKQPLTSMIFGASVYGATAKMADTFVQSIYDKLEDGLNESDPTVLTETLTQINKLLPLGEQINTGMSLKRVQGLVFNAPQILALKSEYGRTVGKSVQNTLNTKFAGFIASRDALNTAAQLSWVMYNAAFTAKVSQVTQAKIEEGSLPFIIREKTGTKVALQSLTQADLAEIRKELKDIEPVILTPMSIANGETARDAGLLAAKQTKSLAQESSEHLAYTTETRFGLPKSGNRTRQYLRGRGLVVESTDPGVAMAIGVTHSLDSGIAAYAQSEIPALHLHDAEAYGVSTAIAGAKALNKYTLKLLAGYSMAGEFSSTLNSTKKAYAEFYDANPDLQAQMDSKIIEAEAIVRRKELKKDPDLRGSFTPESANKLISEHADLMPGLALAADKSKIEFLLGTQNVNQYALPGGEFQVDQATKSKLSKKLDTINAEIALRMSTEAAPVSEKPAPSLSPNDAPRKTPWGVTGKSRGRNNNDILMKIRSGELSTAGDVLNYLETAIGYTTRKGRAEFAHQLVKQLTRLGIADIPIVLVTPDSNIPVPKKAIKSAKGFFSTHEAKYPNGAVYIKSDAFLNSGVNTELMLHELMHAALALRINKARDWAKANPKKYSPVIAILRDLEGLRQQAKEYIANDPKLNTKFKAAVSNVDELISWGMTNAGFQSEVLVKLKTVPTKSSKTNPLIQGFQQFISKLTSLLFGKRSKDNQDYLHNGMAILIANVSGLFNAAEQSVAKDLKTADEVTLGQEDATPHSFTTLETFDALGSDSSFDTLHLRGVLQSVVNAAYGPQGVLKEITQPDAPTTPEQALKEAVDAGTLPYASKALNHFQLTDQQQFVLESLEITLRESSAGKGNLFREALKVFHQAKKEITPADFFNGDYTKANEAQIELAEAAYNFVFKSEVSREGETDFLSQFMAIALVYPPLREKMAGLEGKSNTSIRDAKSLGEILSALLQKILDLLSYRIAEMLKRNVSDSKLLGIAKQLSIKESQQKSRLSRSPGALIKSLEEATNNVAESVKTKLGEVASSDKLNESKIPLVRAASRVTAAIAKDKTEPLLDGAERLMNGAHKRQQTLAEGIFSEVRGPKDKNKFLYGLQLEAGKLTSEKQHIASNAAKLVSGGFKDALSKFQSESATRGFLRTDLASLITANKSNEEIQRVFIDANFRQAEVDKLIAQLPTDLKSGYVGLSKVLAHYMSTGGVRGPLRLNAYNISHMLDTDLQGSVPSSVAKSAEPVIDQLVTLLAIGYLPENIHTTAKELLLTEFSRTDGGNGVALAIKLHSKLQQEAKERLFSDDPVHFVKGYIKETYNPYVTIVAATPKEGEVLRGIGYERGAALQLDPDDSVTTHKSLYVLRHSGLAPRVSGMLFLDGESAMGSKVHGGVTRVTSEGIHFKNKAITGDMQKAKRTNVNKVLDAGLSFDPTKVKNTYSAPVFNRLGEVVNYRYLMQEQTKDILLGRNNQIDNVLGVTASHAFVKAESKVLNAKVISELYDSFNSDYSRNKTAYIEFSENSEDSKIREAYKLLPNSTKLEIKEVWGKHGMLLRKDLFNLVVGYNKYSVADSLLTGRANYQAKVAGRIWLEVVRELKDSWVIKNISTLAGNMKFNIAELVLLGLSPVETVKSVVEGWVGINNYQRDKKELDELELLISLEHGGIKTDEINSRIVELRDAIKRNPVTPIVKAGLYHTIVEDLADTEDPYSFKSGLSGKLAAATATESKSLNMLKLGVKTLYMAHDTPLYRLMNQFTHQSDFVARYALHKHLTGDPSKAITKLDAVLETDRAFVNYGTPTHEKIQYANDMGFVPFTKYYFRMQHVLLGAMKDKPGRAIGMLTLSNYFDLVSDISDPLLWEWLQRNPGGLGALNYPSAVGDILTVDTLDTLL